MLRVEKLSKQFSRKSPPALREVSFSVESGRICGLLGHNGAGKSTALGIVLGMVYPDEGEVFIDEISVQNSRPLALQKIGAIFETPAFYDYLSGWHNLRILTSYSKIITKSSTREMVDWVGLSDRIHDKVGTYSHGMRQRLALAQAMLPRPQLLILDEPTDGLDPEGIFEFREMLFRLRNEMGLTVLLSSHLLSEVEQCCDEVIILQKGQIVYKGDAKHLDEEKSYFEIIAEDEPKLIEDCKTQGGEYRDGVFTFAQAEEAPDLLNSLIASGNRIHSFQKREHSLEKLYMKLSSGHRETKGDSS